MPPHARRFVYADPKIKARVNWLLDCGFPGSKIRRLGLDRPMTDDAFRVLLKQYKVASECSQKGEK